MTTNQNNDINNPGEPGSVQRLIYESARCMTPSDYERFARLADHVLGNLWKRGEYDTTISLLVNGLAAMAEQTVRLQKARAV